MNPLWSQSIKCISVIVILLLCSIHVKAQWEKDYLPKEVYNEYSLNLIRSLTIQGAQQLLLLRKDEEYLTEYIAGNTQDLIGLVQSEKIINDDSLKSYLHNVIKKITSTNNIITPRKVLVLKSTKINAYSLADGTLLICNGLLAKLNSEEELGFILAHEMAHWHFKHYKEKIIQYISYTEQYTPEKQLKSLQKRTYSIDNIRNLKRWHYDQRKFSREIEFKADSLALILYNNAYQNPENGILAIQNLDSGLVQAPYLGASIFRDFNFKEYPFNKDWAIVSPSGGHVDVSNYHAFDPDSSMTHPMIEERITSIKSYIGVINEGFTAPNDSVYQVIKTNAQFENIGSAIGYGNYDQALYCALRLKHKYPLNAYLVENIGNILLSAYEMKKDEYSIVYDEDTTGYNREQLYVYNFVHNASRKDLSEIGYYFMNKKENFCHEKEVHYLILYEMCGNISQMRMRAMVKNKYIENFPKGKYLSEMD